VIKGSHHELVSPPWRRVDGTIMQTARAIRHAYDRALLDLGLTLPEASLLSYVAEVAPLTQTQLAQQLGTGRAATGARIDRLEAQKAVQRRPDPRDRRVWRVHITDVGRDLVSTIIAIDEDLRKQLRVGIDRNELQQLASVLVRLQQNLVDLEEACSRREQSP
jgi:MarR family transcriptional regulator, transcriptional regulator for hemolysin